MSPPRILSRQQIEGRIAKSQLIVIFEGNVLRLDKWVDKHPGGKLPILHMVGKDATDEIQIYHSADTLRKMSKFRIGRINVPWINFEPPISGGKFRQYPENDGMRCSESGVKSCIYSPASSKAPTVFVPIKTKVVRFSCPDSEAGDSALSNLEKRIETISVVSRTLGKFPTQYTPVEFVGYAEKLEVDSDVRQYPSVDPEIQRRIVLKYRQLHQSVEACGLYDCRYVEYAKESCRYITLLLMCILALRYQWYMTSAVFLGFFWHQVMFSAHDAGHLAITHNFVIDTLIGIFVADFCCGLSIGWWKSSHNVHHLVPNHPVHDPDVQNVPLFATSPTFFKSIRSTYYNFNFVWDKAAEVAVQVQRYTYYPIMCVARFNLYILSWLHLISDRSRTLGSSSWTRPTELLCMACYWYIFGYLIVWKSIPTWTLRIAFVLTSHITTMPLHIQITLSHFGMSTSDLGPTESFAQKQLRTTMDIDCPAWLDFIHGGLQFQAVHHLFPRVPRHNLRAVQGLVKEFCGEVGIEYTIFGFVEGNKVVLSRLGEISKQVELLVKCQNYMVETGESGLH